MNMAIILKQETRHMISEWGRYFTDQAFWRFGIFSSEVTLINVIFRLCNTIYTLKWMMCIKHSPAISNHFKDFILYSQSKIPTLNFKNTDWVPDKVQKISDIALWVY